MKIAIECKSLLLQKALENFLKPYLSSKKHCDILIKDEQVDDNRLFYISTNKDAHLIKPFSKTELILTLEKRFSSLNRTETKDTVTQKLPFEVLEKRIEQLTQEYQYNIIQTIKAFYE
jgi:hypothetical protein